MPRIIFVWFGDGSFAKEKILWISILIFEGGFSSRSSIVSGVGGLFLSSPLEDINTSTSSEFLFLLEDIRDASLSAGASGACVQHGGKVGAAVGAGVGGGPAVVTVDWLLHGSNGYGKKYPL